MKIKIAFQTPDAVAEALRDYLQDQQNVFLDQHQVQWPRELSTEAADELAEIRHTVEQNVHTAAARWMRYGELLTVEIDTEAGTCVVVPVRS